LLSAATAAPLATGDLALYFDFDQDWQTTGIVPDESNNLDSKLWTLNRSCLAF